MRKKEKRMKAAVHAVAEKKEKQFAKARELSPNLDEPVEKSLAKRSADEVRPTSS